MDIAYDWITEIPGVFARHDGPAGQRSRALGLLIGRRQASLDG